MAPPLATAGIGNGLETLWQLAHLFGIQHDPGFSCQLKMILVGVVQLPACIAAQGPYKDSFGGIGSRTVAFPDAPVSLRQAQLHPVGGAIDAAMEPPWIDKSLQ